jgi:hypothetical protein
MPGGDRTGPQGLGPRTGRARGYCSGSSVPGYANPPFPIYGQGLRIRRGRGFWGRGRGFWRRDYYPETYYEPAPYYRDAYSEPSRENEKSYLEDMIKDLEGELKAIRERLKELSKEKKELP